MRPSPLRATVTVIYANGGRGIRTPKSLRTPVFKLAEAFCDGLSVLVSRCETRETSSRVLYAVGAFCVCLRRNVPSRSQRGESLEMLTAQMGIAHRRAQITVTHRLLHV